MTEPAPELSRPIRIDQIGPRTRDLPVDATAEERIALARRFRLIAIDALSGVVTVSRDAQGVLADGSVTADVVQRCVATDEPLPTHIDAPFHVRFVEETAGLSPDEEYELDEAEGDTMFYAGGAVDIGEAVAQTLALALDPYPRSPDAEAHLKAAGVLSEEEAGAFGALKGLFGKKD